MVVLRITKITRGGSFASLTHNGLLTPRDDDKNQQHKPRSSTSFLFSFLFSWTYRPAASKQHKPAFGERVGGWKFLADEATPAWWRRRGRFHFSIVRYGHVEGNMACGFRPLHVPDLTRHACSPSVAPYYISLTISVHLSIRYTTILDQYPAPRRRFFFLPPFLAFPSRCRCCPKRLQVQQPPQANVGTPTRGVEEEGERRKR